MQGWTWSEAKYDNGTIICQVPELDYGKLTSGVDGETSGLSFNVDVALNGQQFTGKPLQFRYYDVEVEKIDPAIGPSEGGTVINIMGAGLYDSSIKRVKFLVDYSSPVVDASGQVNERVVTAQWDRKLKCLQCIVPPLTWLFNGTEIPEDELEVIKQVPVKILLTFNNQEWIEALQFKYYDHKVERIAFATGFGAEIADQAERDKLWKADEPIEKYPDDLPAEEVKKRDEEKVRKAQEETEESQTVPKRRGTKIFIFGNDFCKMDTVKVKFIHSGTGVSKELFGISAATGQIVFKNSKKLACEVPDLGPEVPVGNHLVSVEVSLNGQQFSSNGIQFLYNSVDPALSEEDLRKMDEAEEKERAKKAPPKKK